MLPFIYGSFENQFYFLHRAFAFPTSTVAAVTVAVNMVACNFFFCARIQVLTFKSNAWGVVVVLGNALLISARE